MTPRTRALFLALALALLTATSAPHAQTPPPGLAVFPVLDWKTSHARVAVDAEGGTHLAFFYREPDVANRPTHAVYAYCATQCDQRTSWQQVGIGDRIREVELELTAAGAPRLLVTAESTVVAGGRDYTYAACDTGCTDPAAWTVTRVASATTPFDGGDAFAQHAFALDSTGAPRFVYYDQNRAAGHAGLFLASCDAQCDDAGQWRELLLTRSNLRGEERAYHPSLAFSPDDRPRVLSADFFAIASTQASLGYLACERYCDDSANWERVVLAPRGTGARASADLAVDAGGSPRIAFYQEALPGGRGQRLVWMACDGGCLQADSWVTLDLGRGAASGQEPDIELDGQGRPWIAFLDAARGGVGITTCDSTCVDLRRWRFGHVEDHTDLARVWPGGYPQGCGNGAWNAAAPSLVLPSGDAPLVGFDATYHATCLYDEIPEDDIPPVTAPHEIERAVRLVSVTGAMTPPSIGAPVLEARVSDDTVWLSWSDPVVGGRPEEGYVLEVGRTPGFSERLALVPLRGNLTSFAGVPVGVYYFRITAIYYDADSPVSNEVMVAIGGALPPSAPTLHAPVVSQRTVTLRWSDGDGGAPTGYLLIASATPGGAPIAALPVSGSSVSIPDVPPGTYFVRLVASNAAGASAPSNEVAVAVGVVPRPGAPTLHAPAVSNRTVTLSWSAGAGGAPSSYILFASATPGGAPIATVLLSGAGASFPNVPPGTYYLRLVASNAAGASAPSAELRLTVP